MALGCPAGALAAGDGGALGLSAGTAWGGAFRGTSWWLRVFQGLGEGPETDICQFVYLKMAKNIFSDGKTVTCGTVKKLSNYGTV